MGFHELTILALVAALAWAAVSDAFWFRIPNAVPIAIVALYPIYLLSGGNGLETAHWALLIAAGAFLAGFVLFARGAMGGGDVKLLSALALWAGPQYFPSLVLVIAITGGILSLAILATVRNPYLALATLHVRAALGLPVAPTSAKGGRTIPYGIAIAVGGLLLARALVSPAGV